MLKTVIGRQFFHAFSSPSVVFSNQSCCGFRSAVGMFRLPAQILRIMKMLQFILFTACLSVHAAGVAQNVTLSGKDMTLKQVFTVIEKQTGYVFLNNKGILDRTKAVSLTVTNLPLKELLDLVLKNQQLEYNIRGKTIIISPKLLDDPSGNSSPVVPAGQQVFVSINGIVRDQEGKALEGASVRIKGTTRGATTDAIGMFVLKGIEDDAVIIISSVGYVSLSVPVSSLVNAANGDVLLLQKGKVIKKSSFDYVFTLPSEQKALSEVVVSTGMFERNKETFTGVTRTYSGKELRAASRVNILEGLNMLDPSFKIIRDNNLGGDPNQVPKVEMRGNRSVPPPTSNKYSQQLKLQYEQDPNQPLFILDGFETDMATIVNLDVNRIANITLLKDAASTALYGSRSANGVVVVETIRPAPGGLLISYTATANVTLPDLSGYNMMNSRELLTFQELASVGDGAPGPFAIDWTGENSLLAQLKHTYRENAVLSGVNTNWMKVPLQNIGSMNHALSVSGGDQYFSYNVGLNRLSNIGVMKGSENKTTSGYAILTYRKNKINVTNNLSITDNNQQASPYGSFSDWVKTPPYYTANKNDRYLEEQHATFYTQYGSLSNKSFNFENPLYNAQLPYKNSVNNLTITNNLMANWNVLPSLRLSTGLQYSRSVGHSDYFVSPLNTKFDFVDTGLKGSYDYSSATTQMYKGFLTATYNKTFAGKHIVRMDVRGDVGQTRSDDQSISAVGFATTAEPLIYLANSYKPDSKPGGATTQRNSMALIGSLNYSYDMRYNLDLSYNLSGASNFGSDNPYQSFYAVGLGWNIGREAFLSKSKVINQLSLTANLGLTGNQNAGNFGSNTTYNLLNDPTFFGEAVRLAGLGNPDLDWTKTYNLSYSLSGVLFNNSISFTLSGYRNLTDPLIVTMPLPPSVGVPTDGLPKNIGILTSTGLELTADIRVVNTRNWTLNIGFNAPLLYKSEYSGLGNALAKFNDSARNGGYLQRYYDGGSPDDVYAVRSLGIGQARGFEVFLDKNGKETYIFDINNEVVVGSSRAVTQGNINIRTRFKKFTLSVYGKYVIGETKFNSALYNKVENISASQMEYNQDKRALYVRWKQPGDDASFLGITNMTQGMSSRFLQKENSILVDAINFNYDVFNEYSKGFKSYIIRKIGLKSLGFGITTSNIFQFRFSNIEMERGLDYPFQRSISFNLNTTF